MNRSKVVRGAVASGFAWTLFLAEEANSQELTAPPPAETPASGGLTSYPPEFFAQFNPSHAFEMVQRIPGFSFSAGADVRGFGGAAGNVLIDGERPASKTVGLDTALQRIPASQVERIELVRGGAAGIDMQGQAVVANVIRKKGASSSVTLNLLVKPFPDGFVGFIPRIEGTWRSGPLAVEGQLGYRNDRIPSSGGGPISRINRFGQTVLSGGFDADHRQELINFNTAVEYRPGAEMMRFNLSGAQETINQRERSDLRNAGGAFTVFNDSEEVDEDWEVGGDYERPLTDTLSGRLVALATFGTSQGTGVSRGDGEVVRNVEDSESGERILRGVLTATPTAALRLEGGAEAAFNFLDSRSSLTENGAPVPLPNANVRVEEQRGEAFATASLQVNTTLSVEGGLRYERSTISQSGGADLEKTLSFVKPRLIASWAPDEDSQLRLRIEREVGQLEFRDFAASAELDTGAHSAGNADLEPERAWVAEAAFERRFWGSGAAVLTITHAEIQSVVDLIPIDNRYDAPGNIGDGVRDSVKLDLTLPFDPIGWKGARLKFNGEWLQSQVTDPVTGKSRRISNDKPFASTWLFTQSLPSLDSVFSIETEMDDQRISYRISEYRRFADSAFMKIFWDWTPRPNLTFRFQSENTTSQVEVRKRVLYSGPRSAGVISAYERRESKLHPFFMVRMRATF